MTTAALMGGAVTRVTESPGYRTCDIISDSPDTP